jgi:hypothetical protein
MNDDDLIRAYRALDGAADRLADRFKPATRRRVRSNSGRWFVAAVAATLAIAAIGLAALRRNPEPAPPRETAREHQPVEPPKPERVPDLPKRETPKPEEPVPPTPPSPPPAPSPVVPEPEPPRPEPKREEPKPPTRTEVAKLPLEEITGTFSINGKASRGMKSTELAHGDTIVADTATKLVVAKDRFVLLAPKASVSVESPDALRLAKGELIAEFAKLKVVTDAGTMAPLGTVFAARLEGKRTHVLVEDGSVDVAGTIVKAGQQAVAEQGEAVAVSAGDFRRLAWARAHRAAERVLFEQKFEGGKVDLKRKDPPFFRVPVRGRVTLVVRVDRAAEVGLQLHQMDPKGNFRVDTWIAKAGSWQTITVDLDKIPPNVEPKRAGTMDVGAAVDAISVIGDAEVQSIKIVEVRP